MVAAGRSVYPINPMSVSRYRDRHSVARRKSDAGDALVLANVLRTDLAAHRPLPADSELAQAIAVLARAQQDAVWARTDAHNTLRSLLREFYPALLQAFAHKRGGLLRPEARALLAAERPQGLRRQRAGDPGQRQVHRGAAPAGQEPAPGLGRVCLGVRRADRLTRSPRPLRPPQSRRGPARRRATQPVQPAPGLPAPLPAHRPDLRRSHRVPHDLINTPMHAPLDKITAWDVFIASDPRANDCRQHSTPSHEFAQYYNAHRPPLTGGIRSRCGAAKRPLRRDQFGGIPHEYVQVAGHDRVVGTHSLRHARPREHHPCRRVDAVEPGHDQPAAA